MATDQKKRTLEALQRRFDLAKSEAQQQQDKAKKRPREEAQPQSRQTTETPTTAAPQEDNFKTPVSKRAYNFFTGYAPAQSSSKKSDYKTKRKIDVETQNPAYSEISQPVHKNLLNDGVKLSNTQMIGDVLHELFKNGDEAGRYASGLQNKKIDKWFQLDACVQGRDASSAAHIKTLKSHTKRCKKHMSAKQHRKCGSFDLAPEFHKFDKFKPMHEMWKDYILKLLNNLGQKQQIAKLLYSADLHGAILQVVESKVNSFSGVMGIMVRETAETFGIITRENKFRVVPKRGSVFLLRADCWKITLLGDELTSRKYD